ncbi:CD209 antigen-like protein A [Symphorus nematophorus]
MEEIYANVDYGKPIDPRPSVNQTGPRSSDRRFHGAVVLSLGLLSFFLLAGLIGLGVHYGDSMRDSVAELSTIKANLQASNDKLSSISEERDLLNASLQASNDKLSSISEERDLLNASLTEKTKELDRLQSLSKQKKTCTSGWMMFSCSCYLISTISGSWEKGRQDCRDRGADLVIIDSYEKQEFLTKMIKTDTWIGLNDIENEGSWKWTDETPLTKAYWCDRQPDNGDGSPKWGEEDCVHIVKGEKTEKNWNDRKCGAALHWICEKVA